MGINLKTKKLITFIAFNLISLHILSQSYTFTPCGATGRYGPSQTQVTNSYSNTNLNGAVTVSNGVQTWTVPGTGIYRIAASGARGGFGFGIYAGNGARMEGNFFFTAGQVLKIMVGQLGETGYVGGGGGGSFVTDNSNNPFVVAGGGGGGPLWTYTNSTTNLGASTGTGGVNGASGLTVLTAGLGGANANGGGVSPNYTSNVGSGGGGFSGNGSDGNPSTGGLSFLNGGIGGAGTTNTPNIGGSGGFGGGGGADVTLNSGGGGGGGYAGGGGGDYVGGGGGGGSYNTGSSQTNIANDNSGNGFVVISLFGGVFFNSVPITCHGMTNAALTVSMQNVSGPFNYTWMPSGSNSTSLTNLAPGVYTCIATDGNSVTYMSTYTVSDPPTLTINTVSQNSPCIGQAGQVQIQATGGVAPYTYNWSSGNNSILGISYAGPVTCTVTDANNCKVSKTFTITERAPLPMTLTLSSPSVCLGGTVMLTFSAAAVSYTMPTDITPGVPYTPTTTSAILVSATDAYGCVTTSLVGVTVRPLPTINATGPSSLCVGSSVSLSASGALSYTWSTGQTGSPITVTPTSSGIYTAVGSSTFGCQSSATKSITVVNPPIVTANASSLVICSGNTLYLQGGGANSYTWSGSVTNGLAFTPSITNAYTVTGTNACGSNTAAVTITVNNLPHVTAIASTTLTCASTPVTLNGSGASTYTWTGGITDNDTFYPTTSGTYTVTGTDANGCRNTAVKTISVMARPSVSANISSTLMCLGDPLTLFGSGALSYTWTGGVTDNIPFAVSITTNYIVTGTGPNGCENYVLVAVTVTTAPTVTANTSTTFVCQGETLTLFGTGTATNYIWNPAATNNVAFAPAASAIYTLTGTNMCGSDSKTLGIIVNPLPTITASATADQVCLNSTVTLSGGGGSSYTLSSGLANNVAFTPTITATYTVSGADANGCINTAQKTITVLALPSVTANATAFAVCIGTSLTISGAGADTYTWSPTAPNASPFAPPATNIYSVMGTNTLTGCTSTNLAFVTITVNPLPVLSIVASATAVCQGGTVSLTGLNADNYIWTNGITNGTSFVPSQNNTYTLTGTNTLTGCSNTLAESVSVLALPVPTIITSGTVVCVGSPVTLTGIGNYSYNWSNSVINGVAFYPTSNSVYTVTTIDNLTGCTKTETQPVAVNPLPVLTITTSSNTICIGDAVTMTASGANTYNWTNGVVNGQAFSPAVSTTYSVTGTNTLTGCISNLVTQAITVNSLPTLSVSGSPICTGETAIVAASGAANYTWSTNEQGQSIAVVPAISTDYTVTGTDANGCVNTAVYTQTVSECTSLAKFEADENPFTIYPNPNNGHFFISAQQEAVIEILNNVGQRMSLIELGAQDIIEVNMSNLAKGIYVVRTTNKKGFVLEKKLILAE